MPTDVSGKLVTYKVTHEMNVLHEIAISTTQSRNYLQVVRVNCKADTNWTLYLIFLDINESLPVSANKFDSNDTDKSISYFLPFAQFPMILDMLRNEVLEFRVWHQNGTRFMLSCGEAEVGKWS